MEVGLNFIIFSGSIPQFIGAEMFKQGPRPPAMSFAGMLNWLANFAARCDCFQFSLRVQGQKAKKFRSCVTGSANNAYLDHDYSLR